MATITAPPPRLPAPLADAVASPRSSTRPRVVAPPLRPSRVRRSPSPASRCIIRRPSEGVCCLFATGGGRDGDGATATADAGDSVTAAPRARPSRLPAPRLALPLAGHPTKSGAAPGHRGFDRRGSAADDRALDGATVKEDAEDDGDASTRGRGRRRSHGDAPRRAPWIPRPRRTLGLTLPRRGLLSSRPQRRTASDPASRQRGTCGGGVGGAATGAELRPRRGAPARPRHSSASEDSGPDAVAPATALRAALATDGVRRGTVTKGGARGGGPVRWACSGGGRFLRKTGLRYVAITL